MNDYRLYMLHDEKEMTDGHDVYDASNIFKDIDDQFQRIELESRTFICLNNILEKKNRLYLEPDVMRV